MNTELAEALKRDRLAAYARLRGGFPIPLAGAAYWLGLGILGFFASSVKNWSLLAFIATGMIFPLALMFAAIFKNGFMKDKAVANTVLPPAFIAMLLFWPMAIAAFWDYPDLVPLILAIGLSMHWPVIGWSYGRPGIYTAHAVVRAIAVFFIWLYLPESRLTLLPFAVSAIYLLTVLVIAVDSGAVKRRLAGAA